MNTKKLIDKMSPPAKPVIKRGGNRVGGYIIAVTTVIVFVVLNGAWHTYAITHGLHETQELYYLLSSFGIGISSSLFGFGMGLLLLQVHNSIMRSGIK